MSDGKGWLMDGWELLQGRVMPLFFRRYWSIFLRYLSTFSSGKSPWSHLVSGRGHCSRKTTTAWHHPGKSAACLHVVKVTRERM